MESFHLIASIKDRIFRIRAERVCFIFGMFIFVGTLKSFSSLIVKRFAELYNNLSFCQ